MDKRNLHSHYRIEFKVDGTKEFIPKRSFNSEIAAVNYCYLRNMRIDTIHKFNAYKCETCGKWHVGRNDNKTLNEQDKLKLKEKYKQFKIINNL